MSNYPATHARPVGGIPHWIASDGATRYVTFSRDVQKIDALRAFEAICEHNGWNVVSSLPVVSRIDYSLTFTASTN